ncbi:MAG: Fe-S cluster assembly protein SufD [Cohaesibacteraceae bacterium]
MNMELKRIRTEAETAVLEAFIDAQETLPGKSETLSDRRQRMALFEQQGLPHRRVEEWKYTDLRTLMRTIAPLTLSLGEGQAPEVDIPAPLLEDAVQIVIVDGRLVRADNLPQGVALTPLRDALAEGSVSLSGATTPDRAIDALNAAFVSDGAALTVEKGATVETPIEIVSLRSGVEAMSHMRVEVSMGEGASAKIVERHISPDGAATQSSAVTRYAVADDASLDLMRFQMEGNAATHLGETVLDLAGKSNAKLLHIVAGAKLSRSETRVTFNGEESRLDVAGITMVADRQHADLTLYVDHLVPFGDSTETFKSVIDDRARAVFQGKIVVAQDAQKTDAQMSTNALLLSEAADMIAKPELEIFADDVSCAHGATCGEMDEDLLFYLLARGIPHNEARRLLLQAFLSEGAELYDGHPFQSLAFDAIDRWLEEHAARG